MFQFMREPTVISPTTSGQIAPDLFLVLEVHNRGNKGLRYAVVLAHVLLSLCRFTVSPRMLRQGLPT